MVVSYPTTPANYFHLIRRQALRKIIKPLIVMTPKGLLRDARATSPVTDVTHGSFQEILPDPTIAQGARRVILCSGKVFYDLQDYQKKNQITDTAIIRLEQIYPLHTKKLTEILSRHSPDAEILWCQEESENMGAWSHLALRLPSLLKKQVRYVGRDASSSPATGSLVIHTLEQNQLVQEAFAFGSTPSPSTPKKTRTPTSAKKTKPSTPRKKKK
jgi:2-oxoglutarate dehydrogenase E1 component